MTRPYTLRSPVIGKLSRGGSVVAVERVTAPLTHSEPDIAFL